MRSIIYCIAFTILIFCSFIDHDSDVKKGGTLTALSAITLLKKLCNHPDLVYEKILANSEGFEGASKLLPANYNPKYVCQHYQRLIVYR